MINEKLKAAREARNWTVVQAKDYLQIDDQTYRNWESNYQIPNERNIRKLRSLFRLSCEELGFEAKSQ